jgi:hypothetical protein
MSYMSNPIRFGANAALAAPAYDDLWLPVYGGEVLTRYNEYLGIAAKLMRKNIVTGNTAKFPKFGGLSAERHAVGAKLLGLDTENTEITITTDERPLVSHFRLDDVDEAMSHFESRQEFSTQAGQAIAEAHDGYAARLLVNASRETPTTMYGGAGSNFPGGGIDGAGTALSLDIQPAVGTAPTTNQVGTFLSGLDRIIVRWDQLRVPFGQRYVYVSPIFWHAIRQFGSPRSATELANSVTPLFMANDGTYGEQPNPGQFMREMPGFEMALEYNGMAILRSNLLPNGQDLSADDEPKYQGDFTWTRGIAYQQDAVGIVTKMDVMTEMDRDVSRQDWLFVTKMLGGGGSLRCEAAVEIVDDGGA